MATDLPRLLLRLEGAAFLIAGTALYTQWSQGWLFFTLLFLAPDLSMLGYLAGPRTGAYLYNAAHTYVLPLAIGGAAAVSGWTACLAGAFVWVAHIGFDRMLGYGLKYPSAFQDTHLGRIGRG